MFVKNNISNFITNKDIHNYNTRNESQQRIPIHKLELFKNRTSYNGIKFLEHLPDNIRDMQDGKGFKKKIERILIHNAFYTFDEYFNK